MSATRSPLEPILSFFSAASILVFAWITVARYVDASPAMHESPLVALLLVCAPAMDVCRTGSRFSSAGSVKVVSAACLTAMAT